MHSRPCTYTNTNPAVKCRIDNLKRKGNETPTCFLTFTDPSEFLSKRARQTVRSHVTARQHRQARSNDLKASKKSVVQNLVQESTPAQAEWSTTSVEAPNPLELVQQHGADGIGHSPNGYTAYAAQQISAPSRSSTSSQGSVWTDPSTASSWSTVASTGDSFELEAMLKSVEDYMLVVFSPLWWSALSISAESGAIWEECLATYAKQEPALYYARLLFTAGHLLETGVVRPRLCDVLKQKTTAAVHDSLTSDRHASNGLILAVGSLAFYESMYGSEPQIAHHLHRPAQRRMIQFRGGLDSLNLPEIVKAAMRWEDAVMTLQDRGEPLLVSGSDMSACDDYSPALHALRLWVPEQYAALLRHGNDATCSLANAVSLPADEKKLSG